MINKQQYERMLQVLPILKQADAELSHEFQEKAFFTRIPEGHGVFIEGDLVDAIAPLVSGVVQVYKVVESRHEITPDGRLHVHTD